MRGYAQPQFLADHFSGAFWRQILLTHVDAVEPRRYTKICPVIHDQFDGRTEPAFQLPRLLQHLTSAAALIAVLQQDDATSQKLFGGRKQGLAIREA